MKRRSVLKLLGAIAAVPLIGWRHEAAAAECASGPVIITESLGGHRYRVVPAKWSRPTGFSPDGRPFTIENVYAPVEPIPPCLVAEPLRNGETVWAHNGKCFVVHTYSYRT